MSQRNWLWIVVDLALLVGIGLWLWPKSPSPTQVQPVRPGVTATPVHPYIRHRVAPAKPVARPEDQPVVATTVTNAADVYRGAFERYAALSKEEQGILSDWRTNVDDAVTEKLCQKIRPICDLMHKAAAVSNCDWGIEQPMTFDTMLPHLAPSRALGRAAVWSAAHCRVNDGAGAIDDVVADLQLGRQLFHGSALIGMLVDMAMQNTALEYMAANSELFQGAAGARVVAALDDPLDRTAWSQVMGQEVECAENLLGKLAALPAGDAARLLSGILNGEPGGSNIQWSPAVISQLQQVADFERNWAKVLAASTEAEYQAVMRQYDALVAANPIAAALMPTDKLLDKAQRATVNQALVLAGLAVATEGTAALATYPDPATGQPFTYRTVPGGFELQSNYQVNNQPLKIFFPQSATRKEKR